MKKTFLFGLLAAVLGFTSCSKDDDAKNVPVEGITLNATTVELSIGGDPAQATTTLTATVAPVNATEKSVVWTSSNSTVATVTAEGVVNAVAEGTATITATAKDGSGKSATCTVTVVKAATAHLLPGSFSVSATKKVQFTKSNLYWDGSAWKFEAKPTDYPTTREATHVGHFFWAKTAAASYAESYDDGTNATSDKFFADGSDADHTLTVEGTSGLYILSADEWTYLLKTRDNASNLMKGGVKVKVGENTYNNCLIIAPNDPSATSGNVISTDESPILDLATLESKGYVILPAAGRTRGNIINYVGELSTYWSSTPYASDKNFAHCMFVNPTGIAGVDDDMREFGFLLRAVLTENNE